MINFTFNEFLVLTLSLGVLSVITINVISKRLITASTAYWAAWIFLTISTKIALNEEWIADINSITIKYMSELHIGAFIGFLVATIVCPVKKNFTNYSNLVEKYSIFIKKSSRKILILFFFLGMICLVDRINMVGFNSDYFENVRQVHNEQEQTFLMRITTHLSIIVSLFIIINGVIDSKIGVNINKLVTTTLLTAPIGFANGGRGFLLSYFLLYLCSLFLSRDVFTKIKSILTPIESQKIIMFLFSVLIIFSLIGFSRGGYGEELDIVYTILIWPVSTVSAMDTWIYAAESSKGTNGLFSFSWIINSLAKIGLIDYSQEMQILDSIKDYFSVTRNSAIFIPKSIIPELIFDFGSYGVFWGMLFTSFFLQAATLRFVCNGIFFHTLAVLCVLGSFSTIQVSIFSPAFFATLFWAAIYSIYVEKKLLGFSVSKQIKSTL